MRRLTGSLLILFVLLPISNLYAQDSATPIVQVPGKAVYAASQDAAIEHFKTLASVVNRGESSASTLNENSLIYLTATYLLCTVGNGSCPAIIQGVFETDLINSIASGNFGCPLTTKFWEIWNRTDMEQRHHYQMRIADAPKYMKFEKEILPKYQNCTATLKEVTESLKDKSSFIKNRYTTTNKPEADLFPKLVGLLEKIKEKVPNVFIATGSGQGLSEQPTE